MYRTDTKQSRGSRSDNKTLGYGISKVLDVCTVPSIQQKAMPGLGPSMTSGRTPFLQWARQPSPPRHAAAPWPPGAPLQKLVTIEPGAFGSDRKRRRDEPLFSEETEKKRVRRERNRMAAARCRSRRRELTDKLQNETDQLEKEKAQLQDAIAELEKLKDHLQLILDAHQPMCKIRHAAPEPGEAHQPVTVENIKAEPVSSALAGCMSSSSDSGPEKPKVKGKVCPPALPAASTSSSAPLLTPKSDSQYTPLFFFSPSPTPLSLSMVFTYPTSPLDYKAAVQSQQGLPASSSPAALGTSPQTCGVAFRRASSSGDQCSDHSLGSPTLLGL